MTADMHAALTILRALVRAVDKDNEAVPLRVLDVRHEAAQLLTAAGWTF